MVGAGFVYLLWHPSVYPSAWCIKSVLNLYLQTGGMRRHTRPSVICTTAGRNKLSKKHSVHQEGRTNSLVLSIVRNWILTGEVEPSTTGQILSFDTVIK